MPSISPKEKYGTEFTLQSLNHKTALGETVEWHNIAVCITPKLDAPSTLKYSWTITRELAAWAYENFRANPAQAKQFCIIIAWSKHIRIQQGQIIKIWCDWAHLNEIAKYHSPEEYAAQNKPSHAPFENWQRDVFPPGHNQSLE